jgi:hypothetical protein
MQCSLIMSVRWITALIFLEFKTGPDPETVQCTACLSGEVNAVVRDEEVEVHPATQPAWA